MWQPLDYHGRCTCIWDQLKDIIPEDIIQIIDRYAHRGDNIQAVIKQELADADEGKMISLLGHRHAVRKQWIFDGNLRGESFVNMNHRRDQTMITDPAARIVITASPDRVYVKINTTFINVRESIASDNKRDISWGYRGDITGLPRLRAKGGLIFGHMWTPILFKPRRLDV